MASDPNKISQFWQELKRRKVVRVITVYAAAAFVILELISIIVDPLKLPEWTLPFIIVLLCVGFIIAVILSWIYDIHPDGGIVKTDLAHKVKSEDKQKSSNGWKTASYISFVVIVGLVVLNIIPRAKRAEVFADLETSIAVLPFENMSDDASYSYIGGAFTDEIIMELQKIKAFDRVLSRTSTMQYEENRPTIPEIAEKLNVNYIIEGSIQRLEGRVRIRVQVIRTLNEDHIWGESYDEDYIEPSDILDIQSRIAQSVANELKVRITPEEMELIEKVPTTSLTAHDYFLKGREEYTKYWFDNDNLAAIENAKDFYQKALEFDPNYALAYVELARANYLQKITRDWNLLENSLDSVLILTEVALSHDNKIAEAFVVRGHCYRSQGDSERALEEYHKALEINPNEWEAYQGIGLLAANDDPVWVIENYYKAALLNRGAELPGLLRGIAGNYAWAGFIERAKDYYNEQLVHDGDTARYFRHLADLEFIQENYEKAIDFLVKAHAIDSTEIRDLASTGLAYMYSDHHEESLRYLKIWYEKLTARGSLQANEMHRMGYAYWMNGYKDEAKYFFDLQMKYCNDQINSDHPYTQMFYTYYDRAAVYAFRGEVEKAYADLGIFSQRERQGLWMVALIRNDPLFDNLRDDPEFQQIVRDVEAKYQAEHKRVRQWLEENDLL